MRIQQSCIGLILFIFNDFTGTETQFWRFGPPLKFHHYMAKRGKRLSFRGMELSFRENGLSFCGKRTPFPEMEVAFDEMALPNREIRFPFHEMQVRFPDNPNHGTILGAFSCVSDHLFDRSPNNQIDLTTPITQTTTATIQARIDHSKPARVSAV